MRSLFSILAVACVLADHGEGIDISNLEKKILQSDDVWLVEIGSAMCGSCKQFAGQWEKIVSEGKEAGLKFGQVVIDEPGGMEVAEKTKVLNQGIPAVLLFAGGRPHTLMAGSVEPAAKLQQMVKPFLEKLKKNSDGMLIADGAHSHNPHPHTEM